jgi:rhomboid protease GluP
MNDINHAHGNIDEFGRSQRLTLKTNFTAISYIFISINVLVFIILKVYAFRIAEMFEFVRAQGGGSVAAAYNYTLGLFGAKDNLKIVEGEYWRFITPVFLHGSVAHVFFNSYSTFALSIVEKIYGSRKFLFIYLMAGLTGTIASFCFSTQGSVGASGAIFGLMGSLLYFGIEKPKVFKKYFGQRVIMVLLLNIWIGFSMERIDNFAHLGGLLGGFLASGIVSVDGGVENTDKRLGFLILLVLTIVGGIYYGFGVNS